MDAQRYYEKGQLRGGQEVVIRAAHADDTERIVEAFKKLEANSIYMRFFSPKKEITAAELQRFRDTDFDTCVRLLCTIIRNGREIAIASGLYVRVAEDAAEVAFIVEEDYQRQGISKCLLTHLGKIARAKGIKKFTAEVLPHNSAMLGVFRRCGWPMKARTSEGTMHITLALEPG